MLTKIQGFASSIRKEWAALEPHKKDRGLKEAICRTSFCLVLCILLIPLMTPTPLIAVLIIVPSGVGMFWLFFAAGYDGLWADDPDEDED